MADTLYEDVPYRPNALAHRYGENVHLVTEPLLLTQLAQLCAKGTEQPQVNRLVSSLYADLVKVVINAEFPRRQVEVPTRMIDATPHGVYRGQVLDPEVRAVTVDIARAGTLPSQVTYDLLNTLLRPSQVRQDHLVMSRVVDGAERVQGAAVQASKIGGDVEGAIVLFPDPMGATGGSLSTALSLYRDQVPGKLRKAICVHLIVTPEYLRRMTQDHPGARIYALRLDRGMSPPEVLGTVPGARWDLERGLDERQYIVPGAGGLGEVLNNAYV